jgi:predicted nucleic acid-binding protein
MNGRLVIPDASVLLKWVLPGPKEIDSECALRLRESAVIGKVQLIVPSLWFYEVGNTITRQFPKQARELLDLFHAFDLEERSWNSQWLEKCLSLTQTYKVTFYDAAYHSLAIICDGVFVTADEQYVRKTNRAGSVVALQAWV